MTDRLTQDNVQKYKRKLRKAIESKVAVTTSDDDDTATVLAQIEHDINKYRIKLSNIGVGGGDNVVSILLFYAYVEPAWTPVQLRERIFWAERLLASLGMTGR
jgi:hypothetical protein